MSSNKGRAVFVDGSRYAVQEIPGGLLKADLHGIYGWEKVWANSYTALVKNIKKALTGRQ